MTSKPTVENVRFLGAQSLRFSIFSDYSARNLTSSEQARRIGGTYRRLTPDSFSGPTIRSFAW